MNGITKAFPGVVANDSIDFDVRYGEVHTLLGENGAGKSTLVKILFGLYQSDEGSIRLRNDPMEITAPAEAISARIGMIHQHFMLVPTLTVAENVALGTASTRRPFTEVDDLFVILRRMADSGHGLIFISHKLREVMSLSDRITVLRNGRVVQTITPAETSTEELAQMMVGRSVNLAPDKPKREPGGVRLEVQGLTVQGDREEISVRQVDLLVRSGEILGVAGVSGNGQRELAEAIAGLRSVEAGGVVRLDGIDVTDRDVRARRDQGLGYISEERMKDGAIAEFTVGENLLLVEHGSKKFTRRGMLAFGAINKHCEKLVEDFGVKTPSVETPTSSLSGGNIQKVILARELSAKPKVLLACQPTRGVDIGATEYIHNLLIEQRDLGTATLLISEDLDEVLGLADRIAVMYEGRIVGIVPVEEARRNQIGLMMAGVPEQEARNSP